MNRAGTEYDINNLLEEIKQILIKNGYSEEMAEKAKYKALIYCNYILSKIITNYTKDLNKKGE